MAKIEVDDDYIMPFGAFKGKKIRDVPAYYLIWLLREEKAFGKVKIYILNNKTLLERELTMPKFTERITYND